MGKKQCHVVSQGTNIGLMLPVWEITVDCVYSLKTKLWFNGHAKCTVWVSTKLTSLLLAVRTSTVATVSKKVKMITSTHNLPLSSLYKKLFIFSCQEWTNLTETSCIGKKPRDIAFIPSALKRVQGLQALWIRSILTSLKVFIQWSI